MTEAAVTGEIIPHTSQPLAHAREDTSMIMPVITAEEMKASIARWQDLKNAVLDESDWQQAGAKRFIKKSGWEKLAVCFAVSTEIIKHEVQRNTQGDVVSAEVVARATAPNGRFADGIGSCDLQETRFEKASARQKLHHDILATAETRARNRACSNLFGHGEQDAESMAPSGRSDGAYDAGTNAAPSTLPPIPENAPSPTCPNDGRHIMQPRQRKADGKGGVAGSWYWKCPRKREDGEWCNGYRNWEDGIAYVAANTAAPPVEESLRRLVFSLLQQCPRDRIPTILKTFGFGKEDFVNKLADVPEEKLNLMRKYCAGVIDAEREFAKGPNPVQEEEDAV